MPPPPRRSASKGPDLLPGQRGRGALLGLSVGDALGAPLRGRNLIAPLFPQLTTGPRRMPTGGIIKPRLPKPAEPPFEPPVFELRRGQVTDETQLACCLAWSLREVKSYNAADAARRYRAW